MFSRLKMKLTRNAMSRNELKMKRWGNNLNKDDLPNVHSLYKIAGALRKMSKNRRQIVDRRVRILQRARQSLGCP
jgi:hypothetical protein